MNIQNDYIQIQTILQDCKNNNKSILILAAGGISMNIILDYCCKNNYIVEAVEPNKTMISPSIKCKISNEYHKNNIHPDIGCIITSHLLIDNNCPEIIESKVLNIPIILRIDFLNFLCQNIKKNNNIVGIIGSCGKTTTTYMGFLLDRLLGNDPSILGGSYLPSLGSNYYLGNGKVFIENDESRDEHLKLISDDLILTSINEDHIEENCYNNDFNILKNSFIKQINQSKNVIYYSDNGIVDEVINQSNKTPGINCWSYSDVNTASNCYLKSFRSSPLGSTGTIIINKNNFYKILILSVPFFGIKNFLNYMASIFLLINENNYEQIIDCSRFIYLPGERNTYCGHFNNMIIMSNFSQILEEFSSVINEYKIIFPHHKIYMAIEITRIPRYNRELLRIHNLFSQVEEILMAPPFLKSHNQHCNDPLLINKPIKNYKKLRVFDYMDDFYDAIEEIIDNTSDPSLMICCHYRMGCGLKFLLKYNNRANN